jgi:acetyl esterase/lipase
MLHRRTFLLAAAALLLAFPAESGLRERLLERRAQSNGRAGGGKLKPVTESYGPALLDIFAPQNGRNMPVFIHVHGGGWRNGNRKYVQSKPEWFTGNGWVFVSIDYRLLPQAPVTTQAKDVEAAYRWVRSNISQYGGDPSRIAVAGHSAGCHLVALTGCRGGLPGAKALVLSDVDVYDIAAQAERNGLRPMHKEAFPDPALWPELSPITYASTRRHMPMMVIYSRVRGHKRSAAEFAAALKKGGTHAELYDGSAYSHFSINRDFGAEKGGVTAATMDFLSRFVA